VSPVPDVEICRPAESAAYYVTAEALTNIAKYAHASRASVELSADNGCLRVEVSDDGIGGADPSAGTGLSGLRDRVEALDGRLEIISPPGEGTTVRVELPLDR
jgi:signal transduction histidine kinase